MWGAGQAYQWFWMANALTNIKAMNKIATTRLSARSLDIPQACPTVRGIKQVDGKTCHPSGKVLRVEGNRLNFWRVDAGTDHSGPRSTTEEMS